MLSAHEFWRTGPNGGAGRSRERNLGTAAREESRELTAKAAGTSDHQNMLICDIERGRLPELGFSRDRLLQEALHFRSASSQAARGCGGGTQARPVLPSEETASGVTTMSSSAGRLASALSIAGPSSASVSTRSACIPNDRAIPA